MSEPYRVADARARPWDDLEPVIEHLRAGGLVAYPTETVYGFGSAASGPGLERLLDAKGRSPDRPLLLLIDGVDGAPGLVWTPAARELARAFWPGALTLVLADPEGRYPAGVRSGAGGVAVRHSPHPVADALVGALGAPLTSTSANAPGEPPARTAAEAGRAAARLGISPGDLWLVDGGTLPPSDPSTLVDCTVEPPRVLREGSVPVARIHCALPEMSRDA